MGQDGHRARHCRHEPLLRAGLAHGMDSVRAVPPHSRKDSAPLIMEREMFSQMFSSLQSSKVFMKKAIKWIPIVGWSWQFAEIIFLERNWEKDKAVMEKQVANLVDYPDPVWLLLFAEGTRYTAAKHAASIEFAQRAGLEPLQHLFMPRTKGFLLTVDQVRGRFPAIYSCTLAFDTYILFPIKELMNLLMKN